MFPYLSLTHLICCSANLTITSGEFSKLLTSKRWTSLMSRILESITAPSCFRNFCWASTLSHTSLLQCSFSTSMLPLRYASMTGRMSLLTSRRNSTMSKFGSRARISRVAAANSVSCRLSWILCTKALSLVSHLSRMSSATSFALCTSLCSFRPVTFWKNAVVLAWSFTSSHLFSQPVFSGSAETATSVVPVYSSCLYSGLLRVALTSLSFMSNMSLSSSLTIEENLFA
mmetsp:Transcript_5207/g.18252  ORF Transcript_5207/g.18252 Transcript_5207/m.18252 type:complete len:229 (-) Transcript_5207:465-1151(-)